LEQACACDEENAEEDKFLGVADLFGKKEEKTSSDKDHRKEVSAQTEKKEKDATEVGAGGADEVGFGVERGLGVKGEVARFKGEESEQEENSGTEDSEGDDFLAEGGSSAGGFEFGHRIERV
jgi:hypothetical protein